MYKQSTNICDQCGEPFELTRWWQVFCSAACRLKAWRKSKKSENNK